MKIAILLSLSLLVVGCGADTEPQDYDPPAPYDDGPSCTSVGDYCDSNGECCNYKHGAGWCVNDGYGNGVCSDSCFHSSECVSGCCVSLTDGSGACGAYTGQNICK